jgi:hypothetical protein
MDGDDNDEQEDDERNKGGDGDVQTDGATEQEISQSNSGETLPTGEADAREVQEETLDSNPAAQAETAQQSLDVDSGINGTENGRPDINEQAVAAETEDVTMAESELARDPSQAEVGAANDNPRIETSASAPTPPRSDELPIPVAEDSSQSDVKLPEITDVPIESTAQEPAPMELDVQHPLEKPEDSSDALALPVASSVPMPTQTEEVSAEIMQVEEVPAESVAPVSVEEIAPTPIINEPTPDAQPPTEDSTTLGEDSSVPPVERSMTPSPSPARIQEFRAHEAAAEETTVVPGNLPSPSPQPEPVIASLPALSNAVEGSVGGSHVTDVQFGGAASGAEAGQVALEQPSAHEPEGLEMGEVTMEGEADPGKSLGEGDPIGVNGEEEFGDLDVRRADDAQTTGESVPEKTIE